MAEKPKTSEENSRVFDVAKPGTSTPETGSKPMVVGHKSISIDPSMRKTEATPDTDVSSKKISVETAPAEKKVISPIEETPEETKTDAPADIDLTDEEVKDQDEIDLDVEKNANTDTDTDEVIETNEEEELVNKSEATEKTAEEPKTSIDEIVETSNETKTVVPLSEDNVSQTQQEFDELIKSKEYFLDIKPHKSSGSKKLLLVLLILFFGFIGAYALADAEVIPGKDLLPKRFLQPIVITENFSNSTTQEDAIDVITAESIDEKDSVDYPTGFTEFRSSALGFGIWLPPTMQAYTEGLGVEDLTPEESNYIVFGSLDKETVCCGFVAENVFNNENQQEQLNALFKSGGVAAIANESNRINNADDNENIADKTVSDVVKNTRGNIETYEYTVTGSFSTGYFDDTTSGMVVDEPTIVIFFKTETGVVRFYGQINDQSEIIINTLNI